MPSWNPQLCPLKRYLQNTAVTKAREEPDGFIWTLPRIGCLKFQVSATSVKLFCLESGLCRGGLAEGLPKAAQRGSPPPGVRRVMQPPGDRPPKTA